MFRPKQRRNVAPRAVKVANTVSLPAPIAGLNVRDSLAAMDPRFAIQMDNFWPTAWGVYVRRGWQYHATLPSGSTCTSLLHYANPSGQENLFAVTSVGKIYDVTAPSTTPPEVVANTGPRVEFVNFTNVFGTFLICVDGQSTPFFYNGTTWNTLTITGDLGDGGVPPPPPPTPLDSHKLCDVEVFKRRLWFVEKDSTRAWYLDTDSIQGTASMFDLGEVFPRGGYLAEIASWTVDTGEGLNDKLVFVSSEGDIALFSGIDPDQDFRLDGLFRVGPPMNRRSAVKRGGDLVIATREGVVSMAQVLQAQTEGGAQTISEVIKLLLSNITEFDQLSNVQDWQLTVYNRIEMLLYNTRDAQGTTIQYAMNNATRAWTRFLNIDARCWGTLEGEPYFGGPGYVGRFWVGPSDGLSQDLLTPGAPIQAQVIQAYNYFDSAGAQKHFRMARPNLRAGSTPSVSIATIVDYNGVNPTYAPDPTPLGYNFAVWDVSFWDEALWGQNAIPFLRWYNVGNIGMAGAIAMSIKVATPNAIWIATDLVMESGGVL
jgi:hypothetical protein